MTTQLAHAISAVLTKVSLLLVSVAAAQSVYIIQPSSTVPLVPSDPFAGYPLLRRISACESTGSPDGTPRQFDASGSVLWGNSPITGKPVRRDEGLMQINTWVWGPLAKKLGDDLDTEQGNLAFGKYLYNAYGSAPWSASKTCWQEN